MSSDNEYLSMNQKYRELSIIFPYLLSPVTHRTYRSNRKVLFQYFSKIIQKGRDEDDVLLMLLETIFNLYYMILMIVLKVTPNFDLLESM